MNHQQQALAWGAALIANNTSDALHLRLRLDERALFPFAPDAFPNLTDNQKIAALEQILDAIDPDYVPTDHPQERLDGTFRWPLPGKEGPTYFAPK